MSSLIFTSPLVATEFFADGRRPLVCLLLGFILMFAFIRFHTRMIRAQKRWWFRGDIRPSGLHIHHSVFGIISMVVAGILEFALGPGSPGLELLAFAFGAGAALTLDEFALILHLEDVYWTDAGRTSIDAVIMGITFAALFLTNVVPLGIGQMDQLVARSRWAMFAVVAFNASFVVISYLKGKLWTGTVGIFVPFVALVGAVRLARPNSPWAHSRYRDDWEKLDRARRRELGWHRVWAQRKHRVWDLIGGKPHLHLPQRLEHRLRLQQLEQHGRGGGQAASAPPGPVTSQPTAPEQMAGRVTR